MAPLTSFRLERGNAPVAGTPCLHCTGIRHTAHYLTTTRFDTTTQLSGCSATQGTVANYQAMFEGNTRQLTGISNHDRRPPRSGDTLGTDDLGQEAIGASYNNNQDNKQLKK